ncbi:hypothetical protein B0H13DRAFT_1873298 [Mycena leptocephala]|nr:hypothetical protein B0H13DRAFT_1873298 [Mycena leptocephala]
MVQFTRVFALLTVVATGLAVSVKRDVGPVQTCISDITVQTNILADAVVAFNSPNAAAAAAIHADSTTVATTIQHCTDLANGSGPITEADAVAIVTAIRALLSRIATALKTLSDKEGLFAQFPLGFGKAVVLADLTTLQTRGDRKTDLAGEQVTIIAAFTQCIATYKA